jgi:hypothetical protein
MKRRALLGTLTIVRGLVTQLRLALAVVVKAGLLMVAFLSVTLVSLPKLSEAHQANIPPTARPIVAQMTPTHHIALPLIMRNAAIDPRSGTLSYDILVKVEDSAENPIEDAQIIGLYTDDKGDTSVQRRVTDEKGEATFPTSNHVITFEVHFPVGIFPCPNHPPRIPVNPGETTVKFVGCRP